MLPSSTNYFRDSFPFRRKWWFSQILKTVLLHLQASGERFGCEVTRSPVVILACEILNPSRSHTRYSKECKRKRKKKKQNKEKVNRRELKRTRVMSERAHSHTESTTCSSTLFPRWRGICDVPYEGSRLPRRLEWAKRADWLPAGWARLSWAVQCLQLDTQPSVWTRTSCCPSHHPSPLGWWCFLST